MTPRHDLQCEGDRDLRERLLAERDIQKVIEALERKGDKLGARRHLLATAMRLTPEMAPDLHQLIDSCRDTLGVEGPLELFVYPDASLNAAAVRPERGRLMLMVSSTLLESLSPDELKFVAGHEVGHFLFDHHKIPTALLLRGGLRNPSLALDLFAWQRYAEISADRAGLVCAGGLEASASALFKLASGLTGGQFEIRIDQFLAQVGDLKQEAESLAEGDEQPRGDWFSTHPFSPLRLKAAELCAGSEIMREGGITRAQLEAEVYELMTIMSPSYLTARTEMAETMRRLLFAGGVAVASAGGSVSEEAIKELERLLGPGSVPYNLKPEVITADLPARVAAVREKVSPLRRAQVIRDLCVIAAADGKVDEAEEKVIREIAQAVDVASSVIACGLDPQSAECIASRS